MQSATSMLDTVLIYNGHPSPSAINQLELPQRSDQAQQQQSPNSLDITAVMLDSTVRYETSSIISVSVGQISGSS